jgi:predicted HTH domain antitoxin
MANLLVPDEVLKEAGLDQRGAVLELACRLFEAGRLTLWSAAKFAGLDRVGMEEALSARAIPIYRPTLVDLAQDLSTLGHTGG